MAALADVDGILVPGGFGDRGFEGKVLTSKFAREQQVPYFGICYGMQAAVVDYARNVVGRKVPTAPRTTASRRTR